MVVGSSAPASHPVVVDGVVKALGGTVALGGVDPVVPWIDRGAGGPQRLREDHLAPHPDRDVPTDRGEVRVLGHDPVQFSPDDRRRFGYQTQAPVLFLYLSIKGNLSFVASNTAFPCATRRRLRRWSIWSIRDRRRVLLAHASGGCSASSPDGHPCAQSGAAVLDELDSRGRSDPARPLLGALPATCAPRPAPCSSPRVHRRGRPLRPGGGDGRWPPARPRSTSGAYAQAALTAGSRRRRRAAGQVHATRACSIRVSMGPEIIQREDRLALVVPIAPTRSAR